MNSAMDYELPFAVATLAAWSASYVYCVVTSGNKEAFTKCVPVHDAHSAGVILLSLLCLLGDYDEAFPVIYSNAYFVVELFDCLVRKDALYTLHAVLSMAMSLGVYADPEMRALRLSSRGYLVEISNLMLHRWVLTKKKQDFAIFVALFTACRIVWFPMVMNILGENFGYQTWLFATSTVFYLMNVVWWLKMLNMLRTYKERPSSKTLKKEE